MRAALIILTALATLTACAHHGQRHGESDKAGKAPPAPPLPSGLVGDGQQHSYSEPSPR